MDLHFYSSYDTSLYVWLPDAYSTYAYDVTGFHAVLALTALPDVNLVPGESRDDAFNLNGYAHHETLPDSELAYAVDINTDPRCGVSIDAEDNVDIHPEPHWIGYSDITILVTGGGSTARDTFRVTVGGSFTYLPLILKNFPPAPVPTPTPTPPPGGWVTILEETFEAEFPGVWELFDDFPGDGEHYWGKRDCRAYAGSYSGWAVGGGADGALLSCGSDYPDNAESWMIYGPFSLAEATAGDLTFHLWLNSEIEDDRIFRGASTDGAHFYGYSTTGDSQGWVNKVLDLTDVPTLGNLMGQPNVWIGLIFASDSSTNYPEGAYVDDIVLRKYVSASSETGSGSTGRQPAVGPHTLIEAPAHRVRR